MHSDDDSAEANVTEIEIDGVVIATIAQNALHVDIGRLRRLLDEHRSATVVGVVPPAMSPAARHSACTCSVALLADTGVDAVCVVAPVTDAIKRVRNGIVVETVARDDLRWARPPAFAHRSVIEQALNKTGDMATTISLLPDPPDTLSVLPSA